VDRPDIVKILTLLQAFHLKSKKIETDFIHFTDRRKDDLECYYQAAWC